MSNRYLAALQENYNLLGLAATASAFMAVGNPLLLVAGVVAEAAYLIFVPDSNWYSSHLSRRDDAKIQARRDELKAKSLPLLRPQLQTRFERLEAVRREIDGQAVSDAIWLREILRKLDFLLEKFLQFAMKEEQFRAYLAEARNEVEAQSRPPRRETREKWDSRMRQENGFSPPTSSFSAASDANLGESVSIVQSAYDREIALIQADFEAETDADTRPILEKRLEVLRRRREFIGKIGKIVANLGHQLALLEDTFGLISDELLARPPEQVLADIEDVVSQTNTMTQVLEELAPYERMLAQVGNSS
ncbi:hypothetical protein B1R32_1067 [Abditibacterium utsteinense]|uniref:Uncharacterized protein n=1 Tax=Abditibacterium utsteinense TaxID=1960156 RepID=A0A2S8STM8_9BACT|nr:hypothetical protein [Abditibacterium utsteinense]PQV64163.1 hypothetical protein B1R32_1067 [Abditibacterium utsteinense]